jgi:hypothetical protein
MLVVYANICFGLQTIGEGKRYVQNNAEEL